jgi:serine/threonine-protein kinase RsbW
MNKQHSANERPTPHPALAGIHVSPSLMTIEAWMPSEIKAISPLVDQLMRFIEGLHCVVGNEWAVELALREALGNAVIHGNEMDPHKFVQLRFRCELGKGVWVTVKDQGKGFDPAAVPDAVAVERLEEEHGRGIHLMKLAMDEVSFERGGSEVHMRKGPARDLTAELRANNASANHTQGNNSQKAVSAVEMHPDVGGEKQSKQLEDANHRSERIKEERHAGQHFGD